MTGGWWQRAGDRWLVTGSWWQVVGSGLRLKDDQNINCSSIKYHFNIPKEEHSNKNWWKIILIKSMENYFSIHYQFVRRRIKIKDIVVEVHVKKYTCTLKYHLVMQDATNETYWHYPSPSNVTCQLSPTIHHPPHVEKCYYEWWLLKSEFSNSLLFGAANGKSVTL